MPVTVTAKTEASLTKLLAGMDFYTSAPHDQALSILSFLRSQEPVKPITPASGLTGTVLYDALRAMKLSVPTKATMDVLRYVHIKCTPEGILLSGTNLTTRTEVFIPIPNPIFFEALVPHKTLMDAVQKTRKNAITFSLDESVICVFADNAPLLSIPITHPINEAPLPLDLTPFYSEPADLTFLSQVATLASTDESQPIVLTYVQFSQKHTASADGFRLSYTPSSRDIPNDLFIPAPVLIDSAKHIKADAKLTWYKLAFATLYASISGTLKSGATITTYTVVDPGRYPDVKRIIPATLNRTIRLTLADIKAELPKLTTIAKEVAGIMTLTMTLNTLTMSASCGNTEALATVTLNSNDNRDPTPFSIGINIDFLQSAITAFEKLGADELAISFNQPTQPMTFTASDQSSDVHTKIIIMPMRLNN